MSKPEALARADGIGAERTRAESASLDAFVTTHYPRLTRLAGLITRDADQAQDAVQAALERAWRKRHDVRDKASLRSWLDRIVVREAIRQTSGTGLSARLRRDPADWTQYPSSMPEPAELVVLREALGRLSPAHRAVVALQTAGDDRQGHDEGCERAAHLDTFRATEVTLWVTARVSVDRSRPQVCGLAEAFLSRDPTNAPEVASGHPTAPIDGASPQASATIDEPRAMWMR